MTSIGYLTVAEIHEVNGLFYDISSTLLENGESVLRIRLNKEVLSRLDFQKYLTAFKSFCDKERISRFFNRNRYCWEVSTIERETIIQFFKKLEESN